MAARKHLSATRDLIDPAWQAKQNEVLRLWVARTQLLEGEVAHVERNADVASAAWTQARQLLLVDAPTPLAFNRLDPVVRALQYLGRTTEAMGHRQRLDAAGCVPLQPWPPLPTVAAR